MILKAVVEPQTLTKDFTIEAQTNKDTQNNKKQRRGGDQRKKKIITAGMKNR